MPPLYRILEIAAYSLLNFLPFLFLALYPFRNSLRFSNGITYLLIGILTVIQLILGAWVAFFPGDNAATVSAVSTVLYLAFYFLAVKKHFGKTLFTLLMISNIANLIVIVSKSIEGKLFPTLAVQNYRWSFSLMLFAVELIFAVPLFSYMKKIYTPAVEKEPSGLEWRYLWLIPATFYVMWYYAFYGNVSRSSLEIALRPKNAVIMFIINVGEILIYSVVARLILEQNKIMELQQHNHQLAMQSVQYENLKDKILEARRAKHDVRHHVAIMQEYLNNKDYAALKNYLDEYSTGLPDETLVCFCENSAANAVLSHFAQRAKNEGIAYTVKTGIPKDPGIPDTDIAVLLGNLIENALDACRAENGSDKKIDIRANTTDTSLCITVDNTFTGTLEYMPDDALFSTKHDGIGLGTQSVKSIVAQHGGVCRFEAKDGMFFASVYCQITQE